jgi:hypothetical protein
MRHHKKAIAILAPIAALALGVSTAWAASTDTDDHASLAAGTVVKGTLKSGTTLTFAGTIDGFGITVTCTGFTASGKIPSKGLKVTLTTPPTFSGCKDTLGGTDTVTTNSTNGKWAVQEIDLANDEAATEPNTGDKLALVIPKAGATFTSSVVSGCVITVAPTATAKVTGAYDDVSTVTDKNASVPVSGSGCTATAAKATGTIVLSPGFHDVS